MTKNLLPDSNVDRLVEGYYALVAQEFAELATISDPHKRDAKTAEIRKVFADVLQQYLKLRQTRASLGLDKPAPVEDLKRNEAFGNAIDLSSGAS